MNLREMLIREEGYEQKAYPDPLTHAEPWTVGVGHTGPEVHPGTVWTDAQIEQALTDDIDRATLKCEREFPWFPQLNDARQAVLIAMAFQMGFTGLCGFVNMLALCAKGDYEGAADHMRASRWAHQTPSRAIRMASQMESGRWT